MTSSVHTKFLLKTGSTQKGDICYQGEQSLFFQSRFIFSKEAKHFLLKICNVEYIQLFFITVSHLQVITFHAILTWTSVYIYYEAVVRRYVI